MRTVSEWLQQLNGTPEGRIWHANLKLDLRTGNLAQDQVDRFMQRIAQHLSTHPERDDPFDLIVEVLTAHAPEFVRVGQHAPTALEPLSRILDMRSFVDFHLDLAALGLETDDLLAERVLELWDDFITPDLYTGPLQGNLPVFWATPSEDLENLVADAPTGDPASFVRDALGLQHYDVDTYLVCIDLPQDALDIAHVRAPTTFDGGGNPIFAPGPDASGYGFTRMIPLMETGVREIVAQPIALDERFSVRRLGTVQTRSPLVNLESWAHAVEGRITP